MRRQDRVLSERLARAKDRAVAVLFGDSAGLALFLSAFVSFGLVFQFGTIINDNVTLVNTLVALADGQIQLAQTNGNTLPPLPYVDKVVPGMHVRDGTIYGRNYGQIAFAVPFLYLLRAVRLVADLTIVLLGAWCFAVFGTILLTGRELNVHRQASVAGFAVAGLLFAGNIPFAREFPAKLLPVAALQLSTVFAASLIAVVTYRLVGRIHGRRAGLFAGVWLVVASPVFFWATWPKRHSVVAMLFITTVYAFYRSREEPIGGRATRFRALAYGLVGLMMWVYTVDAVIVLIGLAAVDLATARQNDRRTLGFLAGVFILSLVPFFATNYVVAGNPLKPTFLVTRYAGPAGEASSTPNPFFAGDPGGVVGLIIVALTEIVSSSTDPQKLFEVFVRSTYAGELSDGTDTAKDLSVFESMPLAGALVGVVVVVLRRLRSARGRLELRSDGGTAVHTPRTGVQTAVGWLRGLPPAQQTDLLFGVSSLGFVLFYMPFLPVHVTYTVRYFHPVYVVFAYALLRLALVRETLVKWPVSTAATYLVTVLIGGQLFVLWIWQNESTVDAAVQLFAQVSLALAGVLALWVAAMLLVDRDWIRREYQAYGAVLFGVTAGVSTVFYVLVGAKFFAAGSNYLVPILRVVFRNLPLV